MTGNRSDIDHPHAERHGVIYATTAYLIWAVMPLYWKLLSAVPAFELATYRVLWCAISVFAISLARGRVGQLLGIVRRQKLLATLALTSLLITCNWTIFIYCVESRQLVAASLGYYVTPLVSIALGVVLLGERVTPVKILAIALATAGVVWQAVQLGYIPWIALALAFSFGFYGYLRKLTPVDSLDGLTIETCLLFPATLVLIGYWYFDGTGAFPYAGLYIDTLLIVAGPLTAIPLVLFAAGARRVRMVTLGFLQFMSPTLTLVLAVTLLGETFTHLDVITFSCVWSALLIAGLESRIKRFAARCAL